MTARDLIARALRTVGILAQGETPSAAVEQDAFQCLNELIDSWATHRLTIYHVDRSVFSLVTGQQTYTLGVWTGGGAAPTTHFEHTRPVWIDRAGIVTKSNPTMPMELPLDLYTVKDFAQVAIKNVQSALPTALYSDRSFPLINLWFWPLPNVTTLDVALYLPVAVSTFADLTTDYTFPPAYGRALRYNLAVEVCPLFGRPLDQTVVSLAQDSLASVKRANTELTDMDVDNALLAAPERQTFNWLTGSPHR